MLGARLGPRHSCLSDADVVRTVPPPAAGWRLCLLRIRARTVDLPQAGGGDGLRPRRRDRTRGGNPILVPALASAGDQRGRIVRLSVHVARRRVNGEVWWFVRRTGPHGSRRNSGRWRNGAPRRL